MKNTLTLTELSEYIGVKWRTLYRMIADGRFPVKPIEGTKPRRWCKAAVDNWMHSGISA